MSIKNCQECHFKHKVVSKLPLLGMGRTCLGRLMFHWCKNFCYSKLLWSNSCLKILLAILYIAIFCSVYPLSVHLQDLCSLFLVVSFSFSMPSKKFGRNWVLNRAKVPQKWWVHTEAGFWIQITILGYIGCSSSAKSCFIASFFLCHLSPFFQESCIYVTIEIRATRILDCAI